MQVTALPKQPQLNVTALPKQPSLTVQKAQPQGQITSIGTATNQQPYTRKKTLVEFAQDIKKQYPQYAQAPDEQLARDVLAEYPDYASKVDVPQVNPKEYDKQVMSPTDYSRKYEGAGTATLKGLWHEIIKPTVYDAPKAILKMAGKGLASGYRSLESTPDILRGDFDKATETMAKPVLGQKTLGGSTNLENVGTALTAASLLPFGKGVSQVVEGGVVKNGLLQKLLTPGTKGGALSGLGGYLENTPDPTFGGALKSTALGAASGRFGESIAPAFINPKAYKQQLVQDIKNAPQDIKNFSQNLLPKPENIMNRVARLTPTDAAKFEKMTGKSHGEYLTETGNFGNPEKIIQNEYNKFVESKQLADAELAKLPGSYNSPVLDTVLNELAIRESKVSTPGAPSPDLFRISELYQKNKTTGLTMPEINEVKRLYERNVKLGYLKENQTDNIAKATNIDNSLREWQFDIAKKRGLKNLPEINKQTQASKFIVDKLGKQLAGKVGNEAISITDWIMLSGGNLSSVAGFGVKKLFGNKSFQAGIAKQLAPKNTKGLVQPQYGSPEGFMLPAPSANTPKGRQPGISLETIIMPKKIHPLEKGGAGNRSKILRPKYTPGGGKVTQIFGE